MTVAVAPIFTGDRQVDGFARQTVAALEDIESRISTSSADRVMPIDGATQFYAVGDEQTGSYAADAIGGLGLTLGAGAAFGYDGLVREGAIRLKGADATREAVTSAAAGSAITSANAFTVSCWCRFGRFQAAAEDYLVSYSNAAAAAYTFILGATISNSPHTYPVPRFYVTRAAGTTSVSGDRDMGLGPGEWYFLFGRYDGTELTVGVNRTWTTTSIGVASATNWTPGANMRMRLGLSGSASSAMAQVQDVRLDSVARTDAWLLEAYERGLGEAT